MKSIEYDYIVHTISEDNTPAYKAVIPAFSSIVYGDNLQELEDGIRLSIEASIEELQKAKKPIPQPDKQTFYSGKFIVRIDPLLHEKIALEAKARNTSLNKYIEKKLT